MSVLAVIPFTVVVVALMGDRDDLIWPWFLTLGLILAVGAFLDLRKFLRLAFSKKVWWG